MTQKIDLSHINKFDGSFFNIWKHRMTLTFKAEKMWLIVNGEEPLSIAPTTTELVDGTRQALHAEGAGSISNWVDKNAIALTIITKCLENHIVPHVQSCSTTHQAWIALTSIFESQDVITKMHLKDNYVTHSQNERK